VTHYDCDKNAQGINHDNSVGRIRHSQSLRRHFRIAGRSCHRGIASGTGVASGIGIASVRGAGIVPHQ
jgi:hypothetical protein